MQQFRDIIEKVSSDMLLSILSLFRERLPCSQNYHRYMKNYEKVMEAEGMIDYPSARKKLIASPKMISKLSPNLKALGVSSPGGIFKI